MSMRWEDCEEPTKYGTRVSRGFVPGYDTPYEILRLSGSKKDPLYKVDHGFLSSIGFHIDGDDWSGIFTSVAEAKRVIEASVRPRPAKETP